MFRLFQRRNYHSQSDYSELDEEENSNRRLKTIPATSSKYGSEGYSRIPLVNRIRQMPIRYQTAFLSSLGFLISFGIRCNMGVSVVAMTHNETEKFPNGTTKLIRVRLTKSIRRQMKDLYLFSLLNLIGHQVLLELLIVHSFGVISSLKYLVDI